MEFKISFQVNKSTAKILWYQGNVYDIIYVNVLKCNNAINGNKGWLFAAKVVVIFSDLHYIFDVFLR
mgnify:CR=1 FL=1